MKDIEIFFKNVNLVQLSHEPNLSEKFMEKWVIPNHLQYDIDHRVSPYCLGQFIARQNFSEKFIEKHIKHFKSYIGTIFKYQKVSMNFIEKYYKNDVQYFVYLLENKKIKLPIDFIISKCDKRFSKFESIIEAILINYDMPKEFIAKHFDIISYLVYDVEFIDYDNGEMMYSEVITKQNMEKIEALNTKIEIFS